MIGRIFIANNAEHFSELNVKILPQNSLLLQRIPLKNEMISLSMTSMTMFT